MGDPTLKRACGFTVSSVQVIPRARTMECVWRMGPQLQVTPPLWPSDHAGVVARFLLK